MPAGIALPMLAVIFAVLWLVVTAQVLPEDVALVGALPATAARMSSVGEPVTATWLTASICQVTVCVVLCAAADAAAARTRRPLKSTERETFTENLQVVGPSRMSAVAHLLVAIRDEGVLRTVTRFCLANYIFVIEADFVRFVTQWK
jgi:hypothetical protein